MNAVDGTQTRLDLRVVREKAPEVSPEVIYRQPNKRAAIVLCMSSSGLSDDQIAAELDIAPAQLSRIKTGKANFPDEKEGLLMDICGNDIPLQWSAHDRGYALVRLRSEVEAELDRVRAENDELRMKFSHFEDFMKMQGSA